MRNGRDRWSSKGDAKHRPYTYEIIAMKNLTSARMYDTLFIDCNFFETIFDNAVVNGSNFSRAHMVRTNFDHANLMGANFFEANLSGANLKNSNLSLAKIINTNLKNADFSGAEIYSAVFSQKDILEAIGLYQLKKMMVSKRLVLKRLGFEVFDDHFIAYKTFNYFRNSPKKWRLELGSTIKEHINNDVWRMCSRGINVGTKEWCEVNCNNKNLFQLRIPFTAEICIPIWSDGKIRVIEAKIIGNQDNWYTWQ